MLTKKLRFQVQIISPNNYTSYSAKKHLMNMRHKISDACTRCMDVTKRDRTQRRAHLKSNCILRASIFRMEIQLAIRVTSKEERVDSFSELLFRTWIERGRNTSKPFNESDLSLLQRVGMSVSRIICGISVTQRDKKLVVIGTHL